jgi:hypothetical protein
MVLTYFCNIFLKTNADNTVFWYTLIIQNTNQLCKLYENPLIVMQLS